MFVAVWVDSKLTNLDVMFGDDGHLVKMKSRLPNPQGASYLLSHYPWSSDPDNVVVSTVEDILSQLTSKQAHPPIEWTEKEIVTSDEELLKAFVDNRGNPIPMTKQNIGHKTDDEGRQIITFFLKTLKAHQAQQAAPRGNFASTKSSTNNNPLGMDIGGDDGEADEFDESINEETVEDIRADMDDRFSDMSNRMQQSQVQMQQQLASMMNMMSSMNCFIEQAKQQHEKEQQF